MTVVDGFSKAAHVVSPHKTTLGFRNSQTFSPPGISDAKSQTEAPSSYHGCGGPIANQLYLGPLCLLGTTLSPKVGRKGLTRCWRLPSAAWLRRTPLHGHPISTGRICNNICYDSDLSCRTRFCQAVALSIRVPLDVVILTTFQSLLPQPVLLPGNKTLLSSLCLGVGLALLSSEAYHRRLLLRLKIQK